MIEKGNWKGLYKYHNKVHQELKGVDGTKFEIDITKIDNGHFAGTIQDDLATGGTEGVGEITGHVIGNQMYFVKQMPVLTVLILRDGTRKTFNKKHRKIYYTGTFSDDGKTVSGQWKFKFGFTLVGLLLIIGKANKGTWTMTLTE
jgi:hypothetical protein